MSDFEEILDDFLNHNDMHILPAGNHADMPYKICCKRCNRPMLSSELPIPKEVADLVKDVICSICEPSPLSISTVRKEFEVWKRERRK